MVSENNIGLSDSIANAVINILLHFERPTKLIYLGHWLSIHLLFRIKRTTYRDNLERVLAVIRHRYEWVLWRNQIWYINRNKAEAWAFVCGNNFYSFILLKILKMILVGVKWLQLVHVDHLSKIMLPHKLYQYRPHRLLSYSQKQTGLKIKCVSCRLT